MKLVRIAVNYFPKFIHLPVVLVHFTVFAISQPQGGGDGRPKGYLAQHELFSQVSPQWHGCTFMERAGFFLRRMTT